MQRIDFITQNFGEELSPAGVRSFLEAARLTQNELAEAFGIHPNTVNNWANKGCSGGNAAAIRLAALALKFKEERGLFERIV